MAPNRSVVRPALGRSVADYPICVERGWLPVTFTREDLHELWNDARGFHQAKDVETQQRRVSRRPDVEIQFLGLKAECALAELLGVEADRSVRARGDDGHDLICAGCSIQVKFTEHSMPEPFLSFFPGEFRSDVAALVVAIPGTDVLAGPCAIVGWIDRRRFTAEKQVRSWGYGDREVVSWTTLRPFRRAQKILRRGTS